MILTVCFPVVLPAASLCGSAARWTSRFCHYPSLSSPQLQQDGRPSGLTDGRQSTQRVCPCNRYVIDGHCDHIHICKKYTGSRNDDHKTVLTTLEQICHDTGLTTIRHTILGGGVVQQDRSR